MKPKLKRQAQVVAYPALAAPPKSAVAALPYPMAGSVTFADLTSLELKMLYFVVNGWNQRQRSLPNGHSTQPDYAASKAERTFTVSWRVLKTVLRPGWSLHTYDYRDLRLVAKSIKGYEVKRRGAGAWIALMDFVLWEEDPANLTYQMHVDFQLALQRMAAREGFTKVPLEDVMALPETRQICLLLLACKCLNLRERAREIPVPELRASLGLDDAFYDDWRRVARNLKTYVAAINALTSYEITLVPRKERKRVVAVRLDVKKRAAIQRLLPEDDDVIVESSRWAPRKPKVDTLTPKLNKMKPVLKKPPAEGPVTRTVLTKRKPSWMRDAMREAGIAIHIDTPPPEQRWKDEEPVAWGEVDEP